MNYQNLNERQLDALREIGNIGAGNAATALSQMVGEEIGMTVPQVKVLPFALLADQAGGRETVVAGVYLPVLGDIPGELLFVWPYSYAKELAEMILHGQEPSPGLTEMESSALEETGNILAGSFFNALGEFTSLFFSYGVPSFCVDICEAILGSVFCRLGETDDSALLFKTEFLFLTRKIAGSLFYLPQADSLNAIFRAVGVKS